MAQDLELRDYLRTILRRKTLIFVVTLASSLVSGVWAWRQRPKYTATAQVRIMRRQTFADMRRLSLYPIQNNIKTYVHEIRGYKVLRRAAARMVTSTAQIEALVAKLRRSLKVEQEPGTDLINITMTSYDNTEVVAAVKAVAEAFQEYHSETIMREAQTMRRQIENWRDDLLSQLAEDERRLEQFREKNNLVDVTSEGASLTTRLANIDDAISNVEMQAEEFRGRLDFVRKQIAGLMSGKSENLAEQSVAPTRYLEMLKGRIFELQLELASYLATGNYTENHPEVRRVKTLIEKSNLARKQEILSILNTTANRLQADISGLESRLKKLKETRDRLNQRLSQLPELQQQVQEIIRRKNIAEELAVFLSRRYEEARIAAVDYPEVADVVNPPTQATKVIENKIRVAVAGVVLGLLLGIGLAFVAESLDTSIATIATFEETFQLPVLGVIPYILSDLKEVAAPAPESPFRAFGHLFAKVTASLKSTFGFIYGRQQLLHSPHGIELAPLYTPKSPVAEAYRTLRTNIEFYMSQTGARSIMITSANSGEGKTVTAANLSLVLAQLGRRVLLVDADLRKPFIHNLFGLERQRGLSDILLEELPWRETVKGMADIAIGSKASEDVFLAPGLENLSIITCGTVAPQPSEWLSLPQTGAFLEEAAQEYDIVLVDVPPVLPVPDAMIVGRIVDAAVLIYQVGQTSRESMRRALQNLRNNGVNLLGFVLNSLRAEYATQSDFSAYAYYYYGGSDGSSSS